MGIWNAIKGELRSVIQWENASNDDLFYRWSDNGDEIKNASKLIVGPGQGCIFVYEGAVRALYIKPGMVNLKTENIPFWTRITRIMQAFESEHKVGIYFFKTTRILNQRWGTTTPVKYTDPKYHFPVGLKVFGNYSMQITDPETFFATVVGGAPTFSVEGFREVMIGRVIQPLSDYLATATYSYAEIDANRNEIATTLLKDLNPEFAALGFELTDFRLEGTSFDEDTMKRINRIADVSAESQAAQVAGLNYAQMQQLEAMRDAAKNEGGGAGIGMGMGAGIGMGNMMAGAMMGTMAGGQMQGAPAQSSDPMAVLSKLKELLDGGLISAEEYDVKKKEVLSRL